MGTIARSRAAFGHIVAPIVGRAVELPEAVRARHPDLETVHWRRGGLPARVAGWCLGQHAVDAVTLWRTVWLASHTPMTDKLVLHELRHVHQFEESAAFPFRYLWETLRRGYFANRFEVEARAYATHRVRQSPGPPSSDESRGQAHGNIGRHDRPLHHRGGAPPSGSDG